MHDEANVPSLKDIAVVWQDGMKSGKYRTPRGTSAIHDMFSKERLPYGPALAELVDILLTEFEPGRMDPEDVDVEKKVMAQLLRLARTSTPAAEAAQPESGPESESVPEPELELERTVRDLAQRHLDLADALAEARKPGLSDLDRAAALKRAADLTQVIGRTKDYVPSLRDVLDQKATQLDPFLFHRSFLEIEPVTTKLDTVQRLESDIPVTEVAEPTPPRLGTLDEWLAEEAPPGW
ncbi:hypothetical protein R6L23_22815 [Streptomyces sp. SR27]|uniref:hypothetical protein n=1 Tax=Streptomyces sp. SR27 TaxID=3076630 RepID=UPI00295AC287|nr:hypothetical protein [Streptomyces sp. SR27]MDV9191005.1 hypothetical protein [Streptomyces sp. SR27]